MTTWVYVSGVGRLSGLMHLSVIESSHARTTTKIRTLVTNATRPSYQHMICVPPSLRCLTLRIQRCAGLLGSGVRTSMSSSWVFRP